MVRLIPCLLVLFLAPLASSETVLRGSGDNVWIERDGRTQPARSNAKGFTRVETSPNPVVNKRHSPERRRLRNGSITVWVGDHDYHDPHVHDYTPRYHYPSYYRYRSYGYPYSSYRSYPSYRGYGRHSVPGADSRPRGSTTTGHSSSGGAYRR